MSRARHKNQMPATSQRRDLDRNRRTELSGSSRFQLPDRFARRRSGTIALRQYSRSLKIIVDRESSNDNCQHSPKSARTGTVWPDGDFARRIDAASAIFAKSGLSSVRRSTLLAWDTEFLDVASNLPFITVGAAGLLRLRRGSITVVLFSGILLTGVGSSYYHLNPNDSTLFWDRLPMTLCFAAILAAVVEERVDARAGVILLRPLLAIGIFSLLLWRWTDDLRLYAWAQFFPFLTLILILQLFPPKYTGASYWIIAAALYALAKLLEYYDKAVFSAGSILSGHTLKHLAAAAACFSILKLFQTRRPIEGALPSEPRIA